MIYDKDNLEFTQEVWDSSNKKDESVHEVCLINGKIRVFERYDPNKLFSLFLAKRRLRKQAKKLSKGI